MSTNVEQARDGVGQAAGSAKETAQEQAGQAAEKGRGALRRQVDERSTMAGRQASAVADTLRQSAAQMRAEGDPQKARPTPTRTSCSGAWRTWRGSSRG